MKVPVHSGASHSSLLAPHPKHTTHWHGVLRMKRNQRTGTLIVCVPAEQTVHLAGGWPWGGDPPSETTVPGSLVAVGLISAALTERGQRLKVGLLTWPLSACSQQPSSLAGRLPDSLGLAEAHGKPGGACERALTMALRCLRGASALSTRGTCEQQSLLSLVLGKCASAN